MFATIGFVFCCGGRVVLVRRESSVAKEPTGAREELVTDWASCRERDEARFAWPPLIKSREA